MIKFLYVLTQVSHYPNKEPRPVIPTPTNAKDLIASIIGKTTSPEMHSFLKRVHLGVKDDLEINEDKVEYINSQIEWYAQYKDLYCTYDSQNKGRTHLFLLSNPTTVDTFLIAINRMG